MATGRTIRLFCGALFGLAAANAVTLFRDNPVTNVAARRPGSLGDWRVDQAAAYFDRPKYLFAMGRVYLDNDSLPAASDSTLASAIGLEAGIVQARMATSLFSESLRLDPADARVWTALAWAQSLAGDLGAARESMHASWELAPFSKALSISRLMFVDMLTGPMREQLQTPLDDMEIDYASKDLAVAERFRPSEANEILTRSDALSAIANRSKGDR